MIGIRNILKKIIFGSPLEYTVRRISARINRDPYDKQAFAIMKCHLKRDSNCVDIGCHRGSILHEIVKAAPAGTHYAFEPIPDCYQWVNKYYPMVKTFNMALSDHVGEATFQFFPDKPAFSGFNKRMLTDELAQTLTVKVDALDNIIPNNLQVHLIKIDVEGAEYQVLKGAIETIRRNRPIIIFEHGHDGADYFNTTPTDIYRLLCDECDLRITLMERYLRGEAPLSLREFTAQFDQGVYYFMAYSL